MFTFQTSLMSQKRFYRRMQFYVHPLIAKRLEIDADHENKTFSEYIRSLVSTKTELALAKKQSEQKHGTGPKSRN